MTIAENITSGGKEIFATSSGIFVAHNKAFKDIDKSTLNALRDIAAPRMEAYKAMAGNCEIACLKQCARCLFGNIDGTPDIDEDGNITPEVVECDKRGGACKWEGIGCLPKQELSKAQKRVVELVDNSISEISSLLFISENTVRRHLQDARKMYGVKQSKELLKFL